MRRCFLILQKIIKHQYEMNFIADGVYYLLGVSRKRAQDFSKTKQDT